MSNGPEKWGRRVCRSFTHFSPSCEKRHQGLPIARKHNRDPRIGQRRPTLFGRCNRAHFVDTAAGEINPAVGSGGQIVDHANGEGNWGPRECG